MKEPANNERFWRFARSYLRNTFPNPTRTECPADEELQRLVERPLKGDASLTAHLSCCSPCYSRYAELLQEQKLRLRSGVFSRFKAYGRAKPTRLAWACAAALLLCIGSLLVFLGRTPQPTYSAFTLDLRGASEPRGAEHEPSQPEIGIPQRPLDLKIQLPVGSKEGSYLVSLQSGQRVVWSHEAEARPIDRVMTLEVGADFRSLSAGRYQIVLQIGRVRVEYPVQITRP
jgi:hypothetical protein